MALEFHSRTNGWVPAEEIRAGDPAVGVMRPREGTKHLRVTLEPGIVVTRRNVAHQNHRCLINAANGRCRLCQRHMDELAIRRVYRDTEKSAPADVQVEPAEPLASPEPEVGGELTDKAKARLVAAAPRTP